MILAIDTSGRQASVALAAEARVLAELSWTAGGNHSRTVGGAIDHLLGLQDATPRDLTALVVASGPGSFNGLRVGISLAKGLAVGLDVPMVGVPTLDVIAEQVQTCVTDVWALQPAGRGQVYAAHYTSPAGTWQRVGDYLIVDPAELATRAAPGSYLAGPGAEEVAAALETKGVPVGVATGPRGLQRAGYLAELGARYLAAGGADQRDTLEPLYLRPSSAEEKRAAR